MLQGELHPQVPRQRAEVKDKGWLIFMTLLHGVIGLGNGIFAVLGYAFHRPVWLQWYNPIAFFFLGSMAFKFWRKVRGR